MTDQTVHLEFSHDAGPLVKSVARAASPDAARPGITTVNLSPFDAEGRSVKLADAAYVDVWATDSYRIHTARFDKRVDPHVDATHGTVIGWKASHTPGAYLAVTESGVTALAEHATFAGYRKDGHVVSLPAKPLLTVPSGNADKHTVRVTLDQDDAGNVIATVRYGDRSGTAQVLAAQTPNMHQLLPHDPGDRSIVFAPIMSEARDLLKGIAKVARAVAGARSDNPTPVAFRRDPDTGGLRARVATDEYAYDVRITGAHTNELGDDVYAYNPQYLADAAAHATPVMRIRDNLKPALFGSVDSVAALLMPVRIDDMPRIAPLTGVDVSRPAETVKCKREHVTDEHATAVARRDELARQVEQHKATADALRANLQHSQAAVSHTAREKDRIHARLREVEADRDRLSDERAASPDPAGATVARAIERGAAHATATAPTLAAVPDPPNDPPAPDHKTDRKDQNRQLAAALRARGITPNGEAWTLARQRLTDGMPIDQAANINPARHATA
jgi:hypothetical protein